MDCPQETKYIPQSVRGETDSSTLSRKVIIIDYLIENAGWSDYMAAALVGCMVAESSVNPKAVNTGEKNGTLKSSGACNKGAEYGQKGSKWDYGAGLIQWTFVSRKEKALISGGVASSNSSAKNIIVNGGGIEGVSLEKQLDMVLGELRDSYKNANKLIRACSTLKDSLAVIYCGYIGGTWNENRIPNDDDIAKKVNAYKKANANTVDSFQKRLNYANKALEEYRKEKGIS